MVAKNSYPLAGANELVGPKLSFKPTSRLFGEVHGKFVLRV